MRFKNDTIVELPPRARRIRSWITDPDDPEGTTSACAENTCKFQGAGVGAGNYLRVRGEYPPLIARARSNKELPPRARRIRHRRVARGDNRGTTSACAENTDARYFCDATGWNYLRVRGEYTIVNTHECEVLELPPRARRILLEQACDLQIQGTTSACAENTFSEEHAPEPFWNYLRVRGEYTWPPSCFLYTKELPPRARRILAVSFQPLHGSGTTSACAENTPCGAGPCFYGWNYLRVRGEYPNHASSPN